MTAVLRGLNETPNATGPALLGLLDVPVDDPVWLGLDPKERRRRTLDAMKQLLLREAQERPLLVIFEDLHWIDSETQALLDLLIGGLGSSQLLLLVTYRLEYQHAWSSKTFYSQLRLDPLPVKAPHSFLRRFSATSRNSRHLNNVWSSAAIRSSWRKPSGHWSKRKSWRVKLVGTG